MGVLQMQCVLYFELAARKHTDVLPWTSTELPKRPFRQLTFMPIRRTTPRPRTKTQYLLLGKVLRPHGVRGELSIQIATDFPERLKVLEKVYLSDSPDQPDNLQSHNLLSARPQRDTNWLIALEGIEDRDIADRLREQYVYVALEDAVPLAEDEVYLFQVIGLQAETPGGEILGRVMSVIETGANDVYVLRGDKYGEILIPAIKGVVLDTNVEAGRIIIEPLPGLLPDKTEPDIKLENPENPDN